MAAMWLVCASVLLAQADGTRPASPAAAAQPLFGEEKWYKDAAGTAQVFEGALDWTRGTGRIGLPKRYATFRLESRDNDVPLVRLVFANGKDHLLAPYAGHRVRLTAKAMEFGADGEKVAELWPEKIEDVGLAPAGAPFAVAILASTDSLNGVPPDLQHGKMAPQVLNNGKQAAEVLNKAAGDKGESEAKEQLERALKQNLDWAKHTVIILPGGPVHGYDGARVEVDRISAQENGLLIMWKIKPLGERSPGTTYPVTTLLLPKQSGKIQFQQQGKS